MVVTAHELYDTRRRTKGFLWLLDIYLDFEAAAAKNQIHRITIVTVMYIYGKLVETHLPRHQGALKALDLLTFFISQESSRIDLVMKSNYYLPT